MYGSLFRRMLELAFGLIAPLVLKGTGITERRRRAAADLAREFIEVRYDPEGAGGIDDRGLGAKLLLTGFFAIMLGTLYGFLTAASPRPEPAVRWILAGIFGLPLLLVLAALVPRDLRLVASDDHQVDFGEVPVSWLDTGEGAGKSRGELGPDGIARLLGEINEMNRDRGPG